MGYRAHCVKEYKVEIGDCLGFNYGYDDFSNFLDELGVRYYACDNEELHEVETESLLSLTDEQIASFKNDEDKYSAIQSMLKTAKNAKYAKDGYIRIHWF